MTQGLVLVTGGGGNLGQAIAPALRDAGYGVRLMDIDVVEGAPAGVEVVVGDVREPRDIQAATAGVVAVIHAAAWHGIHLRDHSRDDFWDLNVGGTYNVFEAAAAAHVRAVVFSSTMGVYGESRTPAEDGPATRVREDLPLRPTDIYGLSKVLGEEMSSGYARMTGVAGASLRYGMFVPEPFHRAGVRMLYGGVDPRDVAAANIAVLDRLLRDGGHLGAFNVFSALPFGDDDGRLLRTEPLEAIARHWPDAPALLKAAGSELWGPINEVFEIERASTVLEFRPRHGFAQYVEALRAGRSDQAAGISAR